MDAHGTGVVADLCATARKNGATLMLAGASGRVRRLLRLSGLDRVMPRLSREGEDERPGLGIVAAEDQSAYSPDRAPGAGAS
jgi:anti-anti-sigma regulatory factor